MSTRTCRLRALLQFCRNRASTPTRPVWENAYMRHASGETYRLEHLTTLENTRRKNRWTSRGPPASCAHARASTLPSVNVVLGGVLETEAMHAVSPKILGLPAHETVVCDARCSGRLAVIDNRSPCRHPDVYKYAV
jgi:hypothetical protein